MTNLQTVTGWLSRLARLDLRVFQEVRAEPTATSWAISVVAVASFLSGFGSWLFWVFRIDGAGGDAFVKSLILGGLLQIGVWLVWVYIAYQVLARTYGANAEFYEMVRTMGFAFAPMGLSVFIAISSLAIPFGVISVAATVLLTNIAIQATTSAETSQVTIANLAGFVVFAVLMGVLANIGQPQGVAPGLFVFVLK